MTRVVALKTRNWKRILRFSGAGIALSIILVALLYSHFFVPVTKVSDAIISLTQFIVTPDTTMRSVISDLRT